MLHKCNHTRVVRGSENYISMDHFQLTHTPRYPCNDSTRLPLTFDRLTTTEVVGEEQVVEEANYIIPKNERFSQRETDLNWRLI
jgi:hypothetical protein